MFSLCNSAGFRAYACMIEHICDIVNFFIEVIIIVLDLIIYNVQIALDYWLLDLDLG